MRTSSTEGIIIKRHNSGELDRVITVFTKDSGKLKIKASGVRKVMSKRSAHIELLNYTKLTLYKGKGLPILTEAVSIDSFSYIKEDLQKIGIAYHVCELIDKLCPENQENKNVFFLLYNLLVKLYSSYDRTVTINNFEIKLLQLLGYSPSYKNVSFNSSYMIESIIENKLKTRQMLPYFYTS